MGSDGRKHPLYLTRIDIAAETRANLIELLNQTLAYTLDLKTQVKQAHWNVKGLDFYQLHELFDEMAGELEEYVDMIAERVTTLGGLALGTARIAASVSGLPEYPFDAVDGKDHITALADRYAPYGKLLRENIDKTDQLGDADTADLYTEVSRSIDKRLWFLEAHLQVGSVAASNNGAAPTTGAAQKAPTAKAATPKAAAAKTPETKVAAAKTPTTKAAAAKTPETKAATTKATAKAATPKATAAKADASAKSTTTKSATKPTARKPKAKAK